MKIQLIKGVIKTIVYKCFYRRIHIGKRARVLTGLDLYTGSGSGISIGAQFYGRKNITIRAVDGGSVNIGKNVFMNDGVKITCQDKITIGDDVRIGQNVLMYDHDHNYRGDDIIESQGMSVEPIVIEDNVWIGSGVIILKGSVIESGSVIAAGTVIKGHIKRDSLVYNERKIVVKDKH